jgi:two-component system, sensor histidine kinase and response regulator
VAGEPREPLERPLRVLVVDDESYNLDTFRRVFRRDFEMRFATGGEEALELLGEGDYDVVVTDHAMPGMSGVELLTRLRETHPRLGRVMVTAHAELAEVREASASGIPVAVIMKPWRKEELLHWIRHAAKIASPRSAEVDLESKT